MTWNRGSWRVFSWIGCTQRQASRDGWRGHQSLSGEGGDGYSRQAHAADAKGARLAVLDEQHFRETLWDHRPITDFWRVGRGTAHRLEKLGIYDDGRYRALL